LNNRERIELAERFKLSIHFDHTEQPVYALIRGQGRLEASRGVWSLA
jgi:hypothetical protein